MMRWLRSKRTEIDRAQFDGVVRAKVGLAERFDAEQLDALFERTAALVHDKLWEAVGGVDLTPEVQITVAANAAIPILRRDLSWYRTVRAIIIRPTSARSTGVRDGSAAGTLNDAVIDTVGEALPHSGPVAISWDTARFESRHPSRGSNVIIHEFAHKIDMNDGYSDGVPPLRGEPLHDWLEVLDDEYEHVDERPSDAILGDYAWSKRAELFAVATERFFCRPEELAAGKPRLFAALAALYDQDPRRG